MDSMRSLNTSLPAPYSTHPAPPEQLLQAFRTAALSVTNLYKSAVTDQSRSRALGYQEALDDLLTFLDRENLGLQDGEGWRVRQWATERYDGTAHNQHESESEEDRNVANRRSPTRTPVPENVPLPPTTQIEEQRPDNTRIESETELGHNPREHNASASMFVFTGSHQDNVEDNMQTDGLTTSSEIVSESSSTSPTVPIRVGLVNRGNRTTHKPGNTRHGTRSSNREFTFTAGTKRKLQFPDFFDISNVEPREGGDGSDNKRNRVV